MKKIIVAVAIVCVAAFVQAASVTWTTLNIQGKDVVTPAAGWYVELYDSSVTYDYVQAKSGQIKATDATTTTANQSNGWVGFSGSYDGGYVAGDTFEFYAVIYNAASIEDATHYIVSSIKDGKIGATGANSTLAFGNMSLTSAANTWRNSSWTATVPEPTSGILFLVGGALLALRRKRR